VEKKIRELINTMDVKNDREDAESKALIIFKSGPEGLGHLVELGNWVNEKELDAAKNKKLTRAIILAMAMFARKKDFSEPDILKNSDAIRFLCERSADGYHSATDILYNLGFSDSDIQKQRLLSLPIVERHLNDKEISMNEALQEIKTIELVSPLNVILQDCYMIGYSKKHEHTIYRIGKNAFTRRVKRRY